MACEYVEVAYNYRARDGTWRFTRYSPERHEETEKFLVSLGEVPIFRARRKNTGVYQTAYAYSDRLRREGVLLYGDFYLDFDAEATEAGWRAVKQDALAAIYYMQSIYGIDPEMLQIFYSGSKGVHVIVPAKIFGVEPHPRLNEIYRLIYKNISMVLGDTVDPRIYDWVRLFRLPYSRHQETGLFKTEITLEELKTASLMDVRRLARFPRVIPRKPPVLSKKAHYTLRQMEGRLDETARLTDHKGQVWAFLAGLREDVPCMNHLINEGVPEGSRNVSAITLASYLMQRGKSEAEAQGIMLQWNQRNDPPLRPSEITDVVRRTFDESNRYSYGCDSYRQVSGFSIGMCQQFGCPVYLNYERYKSMQGAFARGFRGVQNRRESGSPSTLGSYSQAASGGTSPQRARLGD